MEEFVYFFGYENPQTSKANQRFGTDYESSIVIRISAENQTKAEEWGDEITEKFIKLLHKDDSISWKSQDFASGIELQIDTYLQSYWDKIPQVKYGEYPDLETLEKP